MRNVSNLRIGIELIDDKNWMGGTLYLRNLVFTLNRLPEHERPKIHLMGPQKTVRQIENLLAEEQGNSSAIEIGLLNRLFNFINSAKSESQKLDLVYPGFGNFKGKHKVVRWIPDFQHKYYPSLFSKGELAARDHAINEVAKNDGSVVFSSRNAANDFMRFFPNPKVNTHVWHFHSLISLSGKPDYRIMEKYKIPKKFLYLPNQFWAHKNHWVVLKAIYHIKNDFKCVIPLVCTGFQTDRRNKNYASKLLDFIKEKKNFKSGLFSGSPSQRRATRNIPPGGRSNTTIFI